MHLGMLAWLVRGWQRAKRADVSLPNSLSLPPLSVLIAARNEADNLERYLPTVCKQAYPAPFEVIVALNNTDDRSLAVLEALAAQHPQLRWLNLGASPADWPGKKWALQQAAAAAQHAHLAFIDADCEPEADWLRGLGQHFAQGKAWVLGLGWYRARPGWLNRLIRYETLYTAIQYQGAAAQGYPYMGVGRNLGYLRRYLSQGPGLGAWRASLSGDDDLMVNAWAEPAKTAGMLRAGTRTWSDPPNTWVEWVRQKTRHVSSSAHYSLTSKGLLGTFHLSHLVWHLSGWVALVGFPTLWPLFGLYLASLWLKVRLMQGPVYDTGERGLLLSLYSLEICYFLYNLSVVPLGLIKRPEWRNRTPKYPKIPRKTERW